MKLGVNVTNNPNNDLLCNTYDNEINHKII